jgi:AbrB family looped-hinge helix DNA binding protein
VVLLLHKRHTYCIMCYFDDKVGLHMKFDTGVVTAKGQLVIPARLRRRFGIKQGTVVSFLEENGRLIIQPITQDFIRSVRGSLNSGNEPTKE